jgi:hypothetical protein
MLTRTRFGLKIYAVGGNAEAAAYAGINPGRVKLYALMISGLCAGIAGIILSSRLDAGNGLFGANYLMQAVAAVVIGGTSLFGGVGNVLGTAIGVLIIESIYNGMILTNVPDFWQLIVVGVIVIAASVVDRPRRRHGWWWCEHSGAGRPEARVAVVRRREGARRRHPAAPRRGARPGGDNGAGKTTLVKCLRRPPPDLARSCRRQITAAHSRFCAHARSRPSTEPLARGHARRDAELLPQPRARLPQPMHAGSADEQAPHVPRDGEHLRRAWRREARAARRRLRRPWQMIAVGRAITRGGTS